MEINCAKPYLYINMYAYVLISNYNLASLSPRLSYTAKWNYISLLSLRFSRNNKVHCVFAPAYTCSVRWRISGFRTSWFCFFLPQERRIAQQKEALKNEKEVAEKIAARAYTQQYLANLLPAVFTSLRHHGYFYDPVERGQPRHLLPFWLARVLPPSSAAASFLYICIRY